ncbi:MAG TPA: hypothetical protein VFL55_03610 [Acetobacteraceae bacterium]|nr:hypothetical protein [Acetobacteraceae bacterium]
MAKLLLVAWTFRLIGARQQYRRRPVAKRRAVHVAIPYSPTAIDQPVTHAFPMVAPEKVVAEYFEVCRKSEVDLDLRVMYPIGHRLPQVITADWY